MRRGLIPLAALLVATAVRAAQPSPYTPGSDSDVLERVAVPRLPGVASLSELRAAWAAQPTYVPGVLAYARAALELNRREEDPRYLGYAEAALRPWWDRPRAPPEVMLLRASVRLSRMDYAAAELDLQALIDSGSPEAHAARVTRAGLRLNQGDWKGAMSDCEAAAAYVSAVIATTCNAAARGLAGDAASGLAELERAIDASAGMPLAAEMWARAVAAELALRLGRAEAARLHFELALRRMRAAESVDPALLGSYADFLLDQGEGAKARTLLAPYKRQDSLLLRLALAEQALGLAGDPSGTPLADEYARLLALRFEAMRQRLDRTHMREQALFELRLRGDARSALRLMQQSWTMQREPIDARIYLRSAREAGKPEAARPVLDWIGRTGLDDARLAADLDAVRKQLPPR